MISRKFGILSQKVYIVGDFLTVKPIPIETTTAIAYGATAFILAGLIIKKQAAGNLNFYPGTIQDLYIEDNRVTLEAGVLVQNTSGQSFTLKSFAGNVFANNFLVGNVSNFIPQIIAPNTETVVTVKIRLGVLTIVSDIVRAWQQRSFKQTIELDGRANVDNLPVHIPLKFQIG